MEQTWILCSERLPDDGADVIITDSEGDVYSCNYFKEGIYQGCKHYPVIAWMPLPEPYRDV